MRFATSAEHREFFVRNRYIEFDELLSTTEAAGIKEKADLIIAKKLSVEMSLLQYKSTKDVFLAGRDLWKNDPFIKKIVLRTQFGEIASNLFNKKPLRIAYDQYMKGTTYTPLFTRALSLQQISCFQSIVCGLILRLTDGPVPPHSDFFAPTPQKAGNGIFFNPDIPLKFDPLFEMQDQSFLLIVYCGDKTVYTMEKNDLHTHALKKEGYGFGDLLKSTTHPIVYQ